MKTTWQDLKDWGKLILIFLLAFVAIFCLLGEAEEFSVIIISKLIGVAACLAIYFLWKSI